MSLRTRAIQAIPPTLKAPMRRAFNKVAGLVGLPQKGLSLSSAEYWTDHNVTLHRRFQAAAQSLDSLDWRSGQYFNYESLMPVAGRDGLAILDFGCGPGHDLVGFGHFSRPAQLVGVDVSSSSIAEAQDRLELHNIQAQLIVLEPSAGRLPFADHTFDLVHCSGVLHHIEDPGRILREFRRVLKPRGEVRLMVYNFNSVFVHLYVAYLCRIVQRRYSDVSLEEAFRHLTDGPNCPISRWYTPEQMADLGKRSEFNVEHLGNAVYAYEMSVLPKRFDAILSQDVPKVHRDFLRELTFDEHHFPLWKEQHAGIDGCYRLSPS